MKKLLRASIAIFRAWLRHEERERDSSCPPPPPPPPPPNAKGVPDVVAPAALAPLVRPYFAGTPADGSAADDTTATSASPPRVVWVDGGDEVLVHLDSLTFSIEGEVIIGAIDLETDETGRATLVVAFALSSDGTREPDASAPASAFTLVAEGNARGPALLVARWGHAVQDALFAALMQTAEAHAAERDARPSGLYVHSGSLHFSATTARTK